MARELYLFIFCSATYATLAAFIAIQARDRSNVLLALCCLVTAAWAGSAGFWPEADLGSITGPLDLVRALAWYVFLLNLYRRSAARSDGLRHAFTAIAVCAAVLGAISVSYGVFAREQPFSLFSLPIALRLGLAVCELLLIENLYFNLPEHARWHVAVPCVLLGGLACFDILLCADMVLFRRTSLPLVEARVVATMIVAPLLAIAARRGERWNEQIRLSRTAVFHSATLVLSGAVLLALSLAGELLRHVAGDWGWVAELSLLFAGLIGLALLLSSGSGRSLLQRKVVQHFFADRYDYRREWLRCIQTLSGTEADERAALHTRAIRAVADVVDSPRGVLFLRERGSGPFLWVGSWNMPAGAPIAADHPVVAATRGGHWVVDVDRLGPAVTGTPPLAQLGKLWLAIPLLHDVRIIGLAFVGPPRFPFRMDQEVFDLLRIIGREVATYIAEQRATQVMIQTQDLHEYSKRFAFVAHDIKNVSSQLGLLLRNAEHHIANPEFQKDMLDTVRASVQKIGLLLKRLETPSADGALAALAPVPRLESLVATYRRVRQAKMALDHDGSTGTVAMSGDAFDTAMAHLLNNAVEASAGAPVQVHVRHEAERVVIEIIDRGCGMSPDFIRDHLFKPFSTSKEGGSGIGAFQARELIREAGGELVVTSQPGAGTTMRILLTRADTAGPAQAGVAALTHAGD